MIAIGTFLRTKRVDRLWVKHPYVYHDSLADEHPARAEALQAFPIESGRRHAPGDSRVRRTSGSTASEGESHTG